MQFELTEALLNDILFSMEDQEGEFYIDCQEGVVINREETGVTGALSADRYIELPAWDSSSGFRLMERFAAAFRNPLVRGELSAALNQGKGVFRAFKNTISLYPEAEKLWFSFKEREMKREIVRWYNALREEWGLKKIGLEPEETFDLVLEDFRFRELGGEEKAAVLELYGISLRAGESFFLSGQAQGPGGETLFLAAESGYGEFAGYISADQEGDLLFIRGLEVRPEYRGLGLGKALLSRFLEHIERKSPAIARRIYIDLPVEAEGFSRALIREHFVPCVTRYRLDLEK